MGTATVIDVRPVQEYNAAHVRGAISLPLEQLEARLVELPADSEIVAYCRGAAASTARSACAPSAATAPCVSSVSYSGGGWRTCRSKLAPSEPGRLRAAY